MADQSSNVPAVAIRPHTGGREERPLPPYPQEDTAFNEALTMDVNTRQLTAELGVPGREPRSRGNSASIRSQGNDLATAIRPNRPFRVDRPSHPRRTSSLSLQGPPNSLYRYQNDGAYSPGNSPLLSHTSPSQIRRQHSSDGPTFSDFVKPRWQPDAEVTFCPICRTQFSFFIRKHHCRKCGRVVCNACSPHRITIPYQYIVQPPTEVVSSRPLSEIARPELDSARAGSSTEVTSLGGGERVRLCNPCVPDPNVAPPQPSLNDLPPLYSPTRQGRSASAASSFTHFTRQGSSGPDDLLTFEEALRNDPRRPNILNTSGSPCSPSHAQTYGDRRQHTWEARSRSSTVGGAPQNPGNMAGFGSLRLPLLFRPSEGVNPEPGRTSSLENRTEFNPENPHPTPGPSSSRRKDTPHSRVQPRVRISERDICWVCGRELLSLDGPDSENLRNAHVAACIESRAAQGSSASASNRASGASTSNTSAGVSAEPPRSPYRQSGLFKYKASEKDCVDDAECTICLEEFEEGVEMGRLECFCRFHYKCIQDWWRQKHGQCPVHQPSDY